MFHLKKKEIRNVHFLNLNIGVRTIALSRPSGDSHYQRTSTATSYPANVGKHLVHIVQCFEGYFEAAMKQIKKNHRRINGDLWEFLLTKIVIF